MWACREKKLVVERVGDVGLRLRPFFFSMNKFDTWCDVSSRCVRSRDWPAYRKRH